MNKPSILYSAITAACLALSAEASSIDKHQDESYLGRGIHVISDADLSDMRGRFVVGNNSIMYFGVQMVSSWNSPSGQNLTGGIQMGMDFSGNKSAPIVSFQPTVSIVSGNPIDQVANTNNRSIESGGLSNPKGLVQSVQVAGDNNQASNIAILSVTSEKPSSLIEGSGGTAAEAVSGDASVRASLAKGGLRIDMAIANQGMVEQAIHGQAGDAGGVLQAVSVLGDNHTISNQLQLTLVRDVSAPSSLLHQHVAQSLAQLRPLSQP